MRMFVSSHRVGVKRHLEYTGLHQTCFSSTECSSISWRRKGCGNDELNFEKLGVNENFVSALTNSGFATKSQKKYGHKWQDKTHKLEAVRVILWSTCFCALVWGQNKHVRKLRREKEWEPASTSTHQLKHIWEMLRLRLPYFKTFGIGALYIKEKE